MFRLGVVFVVWVCCFFFPELSWKLRFCKNWRDFTCKEISFLHRKCLKALWLMFMWLQTLVYLKVQHLGVSLPLHLHSGALSFYTACSTLSRASPGTFSKCKVSSTSTLISTQRKVVNTAQDILIYWGHIEKRKALPRTLNLIPHLKVPWRPFMFNCHHSAVRIGKRQPYPSYMEYNKSSVHLCTSAVPQSTETSCNIAVAAAFEVFVGKVVWWGSWSQRGQWGSALPRFLQTILCLAPSPRTALLVSYWLKTMLKWLLHLGETNTLMNDRRICFRHMLVTEMALDCWEELPIALCAGCELQKGYLWAWLNTLFALSRVQSAVSFQTNLYIFYQLFVTGEKLNPRSSSRLPDIWCMTTTSPFHFLINSPSQKQTNNNFSHLFWWRRDGL